jgi:lipopolysaccharide transport protein LptA
MAASIRSIGSLSLALPGLLASSCVALAAAGPATPKESILLECQSSEFDFRSNVLVFHKVKIAQGTTSVAADQAQANGLDFQNSSHWVFRGNVKISMPQGQLTADTADITFVKKLLSTAIINGKPAVFEQRVAKTGRLAQGRAELIEYDVGHGVVKFSKNAWLSDGQTEIRGEALKYNVISQAVIAEAAEQGAQRVHITITPPPNSKP